MHCREMTKRDTRSPRWMVWKPLGQHVLRTAPAPRGILSLSVCSWDGDSVLFLCAFYHLRSNKCKGQKLSSIDDRWSPQMKTKSAGCPPNSDTQSNLEQWSTEDSLHPYRHPESCFLPWPLTGVAARGMKTERCMLPCDFRPALYKSNG